MLIDEVTIKVEAGKGGDGLVAFRREKGVPRGGPWGGNGGDGGDVYIKTIDDIGALRRYRSKKIWQAEDGKPGGIRRHKGKQGKDLVLLVPVGTVVTDHSTGKIYDLDKRDQIILIARGGKGGRGNWEFATATQQAPMFAEKGEPGEIKKLTFELQLIADIGLIGLPNAGKSSLLNELTNASAKVGAYPFTTLEPNLGTLNGLILADIPGLIAGASAGKGLGSKFLRHIARTRTLVHCLSVESDNLIRDYKTVRKELVQFSKKLDKKREIILLTKTDLVEEKEMRKKLAELKQFGKDVLPVSIHDWDKIKKLKEFLLKSQDRR